MLAIFLIVIGLLLRTAPHAPNFTPVAAIALFSGTYLKKKYSLLIPLVLMMASDLIIGMHNTVLFTWGGFVLIALLGVWIKKHKTPARAGYASLISSLVFYLVSNFGVWAMGWYPRNFSGLVSCYVMALPFLRNFTIATIFYTALFFGLYEIVARWVKNTKFSSVLLEI